MIAGMPVHLIEGVVTALCVGVLLLIVSRKVFAPKSLLAEIGRDVGIAFIVAGIVSVAYEYSTRNLEERHTLLDTINAVMLASVPQSAWDEVEDQIIRRNAVRRNVEIRLKLLHDAPLVNGKKVIVPNGQAVLWMSYSYGLYALSPGETSLDVSHEVDYKPMWNAGAQLPRFDRVAVINPDAPAQAWQGHTLKEVCDTKGGLSLTKVRVPGRSENKAVRISTERYELVNVPGYYHLVMRELTAPAKNEPTVRITMLEKPADIDVDVETYYSAHRFTRGPGQTWTLYRTLLPGQGLDILFTKADLH